MESPRNAGRPGSGSTSATTPTNRGLSSKSNTHNNSNSHNTADVGGGGGGDGSSSWVKVHVLEGDGVVPHLFNYLFRMDRAMRGRHHALSAPTEQQQQQQNNSGGNSPTNNAGGSSSSGNNGASGNGHQQQQQGGSGMHHHHSLDVTQGSSALKDNTNPGLSAFSVSSGGATTLSPRPPSSSRGTKANNKKATTANVASSTTTTTGQQQQPPRYALPIPDTVIYDHNFPQAWFSYSKRHREMIKRPGKYLDAQHIYKGMCKVEPGSGGICAQFACYVSENSLPSTTALGSTANFGSNGDGPLISTNAAGERPTDLKVLYLNPQMLEDLLYSRGQYSSLVKQGLLQKFIPPRGSCNDMIEVVWSPKVTVCRRRVNIHSLASRSVSLQHKGATFDGAPHHSLESSANDRVSNELMEMVSLVADNLLRHEHKTVSRLVAIFKQDVDCHPWLHYATSIRVEGDALIAGSIHRLPVNLNPVYQKEPTEVPDDYVTEQSKRKCILSWQGKKKSGDGEGNDEDRTPRYRFTASALTRSASDDEYHQQKAARTIEKRHAAAVESTMSLAASSIPPELKMLENFLEDTFYALYASRMTMGAKARPAIITVPLQVEHFLGKKQLDILLVSIMQLRREKTLEEKREREQEEIRQAQLAEAAAIQQQEEEEEEQRKKEREKEQQDEAKTPTVKKSEKKDEESPEGGSHDKTSRSPTALMHTVAELKNLDPEILEGNNKTTTPSKDDAPSPSTETNNSTSALTPSSPTPAPPSSTSGGGKQLEASASNTTTPSRQLLKGNSSSTAVTGSVTGSSRHLRRGPRIYVSGGGDGAAGTAHHQQHLIPLCTVREQCDVFLEDLRKKIM